MNQFPVDVLLIEDNPSDAELTIREIKKNRLANNLVHLKDGEEAMDYLFADGNRDAQEPLPRLILLDIKMPKVNGFEVLQKLKSEEHTRSIPVIILTSSKEDPDIKRCYEIGANSYIVKPVSFEAFASAIRNLGYYWLLMNQTKN